MLVDREGRVLGRVVTYINRIGGRWALCAVLQLT